MDCRLLDVWMAEAPLRWFGEAYRRYRERDVQCGERRGAAADPQLCATLMLLEAEMSAAAGYVKALAEKCTAAAEQWLAEAEKRIGAADFYPYIEEADASFSLWAGPGLWR
ncbi:hypothetical protein [Pyrobaculum ferrireducens]|uniref:Uncharacterized protein n=1 Tax=Pyrobaculum ferrireducens TaxID=1104324 RepID=G7VI39_9CREN|nr:hypothetical protein [Pyrobaculum ferrireducens]AET32131.1 hypothetical protein P186_0681 [Pyrobaculum ferrireducens]